MSDIVLRTGVFEKKKEGKCRFLYFTDDEIRAGLSGLTRKECEVIELSFIDFSSANISRTLKILDVLEEFTPRFFFVINCSVLPESNKILNKLTRIFSSISLEIQGTGTSGIPDKPNLKKNISRLEQYGIIYSFKYSSFFKSIPDKTEDFNFLFSLRPNSIELSGGSSGDCDFSFCVDFFYNEGRAVPWFLILLSFFKMPPYDFFLEFGSFLNKRSITEIPDKHIDIEKIQLLFIREFLDKKKLSSFYSCISNLIQLNGAYSRAYGEGEETVLELDWNPQDIMGEDIFNIKRFNAEVCKEYGRYKVYNQEGEVLTKNID